MTMLWLGSSRWSASLRDDVKQTPAPLRDTGQAKPEVGEAHEVAKNRQIKRFPALPAPLTVPGEKSVCDGGKYGGNSSKPN
jgi:hypothetical protein